MWMLLAIALPMLAGGALAAWRPKDRTARQNFVVGSACLTAVCAALVSVLWPLASLYAVEYMSREGSENRFFVFYLSSFGVTLGIAFSANVLTMYLFYELLTLATLPLVMHHMDGKARYAGRVYLTYSMCGAALGFIAMVLMIEHGAWFFQFGGSVTVTASKENTLRMAYILGFFGFGVKAAVFPGHKWLLRASVAPTPVTALLHAVAVVKAGVFAVARITWYGFGPDLLRGSWCQYLAMGAAVFTIVYASSKALRTKHLKRRLAWSTVSNLSYILLGIATLTTAGLIAGMVHMVVHAVLKITLFFGVGAVHYKLHRDFVPDVEGCGVLMPVVFGTFAVASLGLMGVPPLAGFASKWLLATAAVGMGKWIGYHRPVPHGDRSAGLLPPAEPAAHRPGAQAGPAGPLLADDRSPDRAVCGVGGPGPGGGRSGAHRLPAAGGMTEK